MTTNNRGKTVVKSRLRGMAPALAAAIASGWLFQSSAFAIGTTYTGPDGGNWNVASSWTTTSLTHVVPVNGDDVQLGNSTLSNSVNLNLSYAGAGLNSLTLDSPGHASITLNQTTAGFNMVVATVENIGTTVSGNFYNQSASNNTTAGLVIGAGAGGSGGYTLSGTGLLTVTGVGGRGLILGNSTTASGSFTQNGGNASISGFLNVGLVNNLLTPSSYNLSNGTLTLTASTNLNVGVAGRGVFTQNGGTVNFAGGGGNLYMATTAGNLNDTYTLSGTGAITNASLIDVGNFGTASFIQTGGSVSANTFALGENITSTGNYSLTSSTGAGNLTTVTEYIGYSGLGNFTQNGGNNTINGGGLVLGLNSTGNGLYTMSSGTLTVGTNAVPNVEVIGSGGNATFTQQGGSHVIWGNLTLGNSVNSNANYFLSIVGGVTVNGEEIIGNGGNGSFSQNGGTNLVTGNLTLGGQLGLSITTGTGSYNLSAGNLTTGNTIVGNTENATFKQTGGTFSTGILTLGRNGSNTVVDNYTLDNTSGTSVLNAATETLGASSAKVTFIQNGGTNNATDLTINYGATYNLNNGTLNSTNETLGLNGLGSFNQFGGIHNVTGAGGYIIAPNLSSSSVGNYTMSGGQLNVPNGLIEVGDDGVATFFQSGGSVVGGQSLVVGSGLGGSPGEASIYTLVGGNLTIASNELIAFDNVGTFTQMGGNNTIGGGLIIAEPADFPGIYNMQGGVLSPNFISVNSLGTLNVSGGVTTVSSILQISSNLPAPVVTLSAGTLNLLNLDTEGVPSNFHWTGGTLGFTNAVTFDPGIAFPTTESAFGNSLTLTGTMSLSVTGIETIGGTSAFTLTLTGNNVTDFASGFIYINPLGSLVQNGGGIISDVMNHGFFASSGGIFGGQLQNFASANISASLTISNGLVNSGVLYPLGLGTVLTLNGTGLNNSGSISVAGGSIAGNITNSGFLSGYGSVGGASNSFTNSGVITQTTTTLQLFSISSPLANTGTINLAPGLALQITAVAATNDGTINLNTGNLLGAFAFTNNSDGIIVGPGKLGMTSFLNNGTLEAPAGTTTTPSFTNNGIVEMAGVAANLGVAATTITNASPGSIEGFGKISAAITNNGIISPVGGTLTIAGNLANPANGTLAITAGSKLLISSGLATNAGLISLTGGTFDNGGHALNNTGVITGWGSLRATTITNSSTLTLLGGTTTVSANITNSAGASLVFKFEPAIINGSITNNGTIKTTNTTITYTGSLTNNPGSTYFSDPSTNIFQSNINNAGTMTGGVGDVFIFLSGSVTNTGTFNNAGTLQSADNINNSGTFTQTGPQTWSNNTTLTNSGNATLTTDTGTALTSPLSILNTAGKLLLSTPQHLHSLNITGGNVTLPTSANPRQDTGIVLKTSSLSIGSSSTLDITNHDLILGNANLLTTQNEILNGIGIGPGGAVLTSSTANAAGNLFLIPLDAAALGIPSWDNVNITDPNSIIVKFTYFGDANLDGLVDGNDFSVIAGNFHNTTPGIANIQQSWLMGDVNLDGFVDGNDFSVVAGNFGAILLTTPTSTPITPTNVPEPTSLTLLSLAPFLLLRRRPK